MRIGIDIFSYDRPGENYGVGPSVYVWRLLPALFRLGARHSFFVFANKDNMSNVQRGPNVNVICSPLPNRPRFLRAFHEQFLIPYWRAKHKLHCIHSLGNNIALCSSEHSILTVYDLMWKYYYDFPGYRTLKHRYFAMTVPKSIRRAKGIITISDYVGKQLQMEFNVPASSVFPVQLSSGGLFPVPSALEKDLRTRYNFPFIFTVTTSLPHKNLGLLIHAFGKVKAMKAFDGKLVVAGQLKGNYHHETMRNIVQLGLQEDVILRGFVSEAEKTFCYMNAVLFVYPSLYEGFGLPILEAMEAGTPVLASNASSIPEVGSDACCYFDPQSTTELEHQMTSLLRDPALQQILRERGFERYRKFSWEKTAQQTLDVYERLFDIGRDE